MRHFIGPADTAGTPLARVDARVKLLTTLALLVMVISARGACFPCLVAAGSVVTILLLGIRPGQLLRRIAQPLAIGVMVLLLKLFLAGSTPLFIWHLPGMVIAGHAEGLAEGVLLMARILGAVSLVSLLGFTTTFTDLMAALAWLRVPRALVDVALFAWRYLFLLFDDALVVYHAQKNRLGYAGYRRGLRSFGTLAGALVIKAFDNSQTVTTAMVQRGYDGTMPLLGSRPFRRGEVFGSLLLVVVGGCLWRGL